MGEHHTRSNIPLKPLYKPEDINSLDYDTHLNEPGSYPYTRGRHARAGVGWIQRELSGEGDPERSNEQLKNKELCASCFLPRSNLKVCSKRETLLKY